MSQPVITVSGVGKRYRIEHAAPRETLRDALQHGARKLWRRYRWGTGFTSEEFWAVRDLNFDLKQGEVLGIIGRNGAGKSTLLKILSRITEPTTGRIQLRGRVASLLEVGTGFHPELSGRENIFLNGAILGMSRVEIRRKFDEIVAFAEVERFLDTPVKRYSSGMYVRLAFAVAAHLEPEILIVDEVLAVGDVAFQKKCIGKMQSVASQEGRSVLFVSHNLRTIRQLCTRAILLEKGRLVCDGTTSVVLSAYSQGLDTGEALQVPKPTADILDRAYVTALALEKLDGSSLTVARVGEPWRIRLEVRIARPMRHFIASVGLITTEGLSLQTVWTDPADLTPGRYEFSFTQQGVALAADSYKVIIGLSEMDHSVQQFEALRLEVSGEDPLIKCVATSGYGLVLNSMQMSTTRL